MIRLPWPDSGLRPNARLHFHAKAKLVKAARETAYWLAKQAYAPYPHKGEVMLFITFLPPDKRRRDLDGMLSSAKAYLDSIADAIEVDDYRFAFTIKRGEPVKGGAVVVEIL